jgi:hypothetical protein
MGAMLAVRKVADYSDGSTRVAMYNPNTGEKFLADPNTGQPRAWPLKGVMFVGDPPERTACSQSFVMNGVTEGWITWTDHKVIHKPGGPVGNEWAVTHTFHEADFLIFNVLVSEDSLDTKQVKYKVLSSPGKQVNADGTSSVEWIYQLELVVE